MTMPTLCQSGPPNPPPMGAIGGNSPCGNWVSRNACRCRRRNCAPLNIYDMVGENTLRSPLHPIRSLRCGQSVGTANTLAKDDHFTFSKKRFSVLSLVV